MPIKLMVKLIQNVAWCGLHIFVFSGWYGTWACVVSCMAIAVCGCQRSPFRDGDWGMLSVLQVGFECRICRRSFIRKADLERHVLTHTGDRPHTCPHCNFACNRRSNLYRHIRSAHPSLLTPHHIAHLDHHAHRPPVTTTVQEHLQSRSWKWKGYCCSYLSSSAQKKVSLQEEKWLW